MTSELVERVQRGDNEATDAFAIAAYDRLSAIAGRIPRASSSVAATTAAWRRLAH